MTLSISLTEESARRCFAPVVNDATRVLLLGSLPGVRSLAEGRYYAHPQNQFWRLIGTIVHQDLTALDYEARLAALRHHRIGLWDAVAEAKRSGSLDSAIRDVAANDLMWLVRRLPALKLIAFNGQTAARIGLRQLGKRVDIATVTLPSSSPAFTQAFKAKLALWRHHLEPALRNV